MESAPEAPEDAAEQAEDSADIAIAKLQTAEEQLGVVLVCRVHGGRGIPGGLHGFVDETGKFPQVI